MSALAARPGGQNHDRLTGGNVSFSTVRMASPENDGPDDVVEITAGQKMLSAMSGSLFTSLLGKFRITKMLMALTAEGESFVR